VEYLEIFGISGLITTILSLPKEVRFIHGSSSDPLSIYPYSKSGKFSIDQLVIPSKAAFFEVNRVRFLPLSRIRNPPNAFC